MLVKDSNASLAVMAEFLTVLLNKWQRVYMEKKRQNSKKGVSFCNLSQTKIQISALPLTGSVTFSRSVNLSGYYLFHL